MQNWRNPARRIPYIITRETILQNSHWMTDGLAIELKAPGGFTQKRILCGSLRLARFRRAVLLPERKNLLPPLRGLFGNFVVVSAGNDLKGFRPAVVSKQLTAGTRRNYFVCASDDKFDRAVIILQVFSRIEPVQQK